MKLLTPYIFSALLLTLNLCLAEQTVLITGANRGIGLEYAKQYTAKGYKVYGTARTPEKATELKETGAEIVKLDVTLDSDITSLKKILKGKAIDILINNAGVMHRTQKDRKALTEAFNVNTASPLLIAYALSENLALSKNPRIINTSSQLSILTDGSGWPAAYAISKAGLNMVTRVLHTELPVITISLNPGWNKTDMGGSNAPLTVKESVPQIIKVINDLEKKDSGKFFDYTGKEMPW